MKKHIHPVVLLKNDLCKGQQTCRDMECKYLLHLALWLQGRRGCVEDAGLPVC